MDKGVPPASQLLPPGRAGLSTRQLSWAQWGGERGGQDEAKQPTKPCTHPPVGQNASPHHPLLPGEEEGGIFYTLMLRVGKGAPSGARRGGEMSGRGSGPPPAPPARAAPSAQPNITATPPGAVGAPPARAAFQHLLLSLGLPGPCPAPPTRCLPPPPGPTQPHRPPMLPGAWERDAGGVLGAAPRGPGTVLGHGLSARAKGCSAGVTVGSRTPQLQTYLGSLLKAPHPTQNREGNAIPRISR